jgi:hypothetical protein
MANLIWLLSRYYILIYVKFYVNSIRFIKKRTAVEGVTY